MTDFQINDHILQKECESLAVDIFVDTCNGMGEDETPEDYRDRMGDMAHDATDGHEWVIYNHKALMLCAHCDVTSGEELLEDTGLPRDVTLYKLACVIASGEMRARIEAHLAEMLDDWEDTREESAE